jgi:hypothetical protein
MNNETMGIVAENVRSANAKKAFEMTSREAFFKLDDKELAAIQAEFKPNDPQYILASHEWNVRLLAHEIKAIRFAALAGIGGTIIGVLLGYLLK